MCLEQPQPAFHFPPRHFHSITDGNGNTTTYTRDPLGRVTEIEYPDSSTETFTYNADGWESSHTDANGTTVATSYNQAGQPLEMDINPGSGVEDTGPADIFEYDGIHRLIDFRGEGMETFLTLTSLDQVGVILQLDGSTNGQTTTFDFDAAGDRVSMTYPNNRVLDLARDDYGRLLSITDGSTALAQYDYVGDAMAKRTYANGIALTVTRDALMRVTGWSHEDGTPSLRAGFEYAYDSLGQKKYAKRTHDDVGDAYRHDGLGQLTGVKTDVPAGDLSASNDYSDYTTQVHERQYELDADGNRKTVDTDSTLEHYNYVSGVYVPDVLNRVTKIESTTRTHDANGNVTDDGTNTYTYNWRNQIVRVYRKSDSHLIAHYVYDAMGRRVMKYIVENGTENGWVSLIYDGDRIIAEADVDGNITATFVNGLEIDEVLSMDRVIGEETKRFYFSEDALGSVALVTDENGANVEKYEYSEYGLPTVYVWDSEQEEWGEGVEGGASSVGNTRMFTGREWDAEIGLYYYRARHYDPRVGRFTTPDPVGPSGDNLTNLYRYALNAPSNRTDPFGLESSWLTRGLGLIRAIGGVFEAAAGVAVGTVTSETGAGIVLGAVVAFHGVDQAVHGVEEMWTGEQQDSWTSQTMQHFGVCKDMANLADAAIGIIGSLGAGTAAAVSRVAAIATEGSEYGLGPLQALWRYEQGSKALNAKDYAAIGEGAFSVFDQATMLEEGINYFGDKMLLTTTALQKVASFMKLMLTTGGTPLGNYAAGYLGAFGNYVASEEGCDSR